MASIVRLDDGKYRAFVHVTRNGRSSRLSRTFPTRREANAWAYEEESKKDKIEPNRQSKYTLKDALRRYAKEVSPTKKGKRWEQISLAAFDNDELPLDKPLHEVHSQDIAKISDNHLTTVHNARVNHDVT